MKPEDLKPSFPRKEKCVLIEDRILYVPDYCTNYEAFTFPGWEHPNLFGNKNPVQVEYCSGNGAWIAAKAAANPNVNWVAVEKKFMRVRKIWSKIKNLCLNNLFIICGEGYNVSNRYFPASSLSGIFINFPDPWPKKRHWKHRIIQQPFVRELLRTLQPQGMMTFVTDDPPYSEWTIQQISQQPTFEFCYPAPHYITDHPEYGTSYFDQLWREKGRLIRYHQFCKSFQG